MKAERLFINWLSNQEYWTKFLYKQFNDNIEITEDIESEFLLHYKNIKI